MPLQTAGIYCPRCSATAEGQQIFCRSCGLNLEIVRWALEYEPEQDVRDRLRILKGALNLVHKRRRKIRRLEIALATVGALGLAVFNITLLTTQKFDWTILGLGSLALGIAIAIEVTLSLRRVLPELKSVIESGSQRQEVE
jgi:hypothetical protein